MKAKRKQELVTRNGAALVERVVMDSKARGRCFLTEWGFVMNGLCNRRWELHDILGRPQFSR